MIIDKPCPLLPFDRLGVCTLCDPTLPASCYQFRICICRLAPAKVLQAIHLATLPKEWAHVTRQIRLETVVRRLLAVGQTFRPDQNRNTYVFACHVGLCSGKPCPWMLRCPSGTEAFLHDGTGTPKIQPERYRAGQRKVPFDANKGQTRKRDRNKFPVSPSTKGSRLLESLFLRARKKMKCGSSCTGRRPRVYFVRFCITEVTWRRNGYPTSQSACILCQISAGIPHQVTRKPLTMEADMLRTDNSPGKKIQRLYT
ncbi:hypothetical protein B0T20DRAFT_89458 [Sordaria brevicollis]|uniref:Uncharacterized protein n=1 Tax=Sordaria brevicollis TaxID=83679 RepID=A0AAE0NWQ3_SORBR|nr:hypothetical protein B0T20DRAFT_89458 [Sordaria brevicollis]